MGAHSACDTRQELIMKLILLFVIFAAAMVAEAKPYGGYHYGKRSADAEPRYGGYHGKREAEPYYGGYHGKRSADAEPGYYGYHGKRSADAEPGYYGSHGKREAEPYYGG